MAARTRDRRLARGGGLRPPKKTGATWAPVSVVHVRARVAGPGLIYQPKPTPTPPEVSLPLTAAPKVRLAFGDNCRE